MTLSCFIKLSTSQLVKETLGAARREQYSTLFLLAAASGLRIGELLALRKDDIGENTIRVDESFDRAGTNGALQKRCSVQNSRPS